MEQQQPAAANERSSRPLVRLPHSTRSFSRSRSRSPSRHDDEDEDDGANGHAPSGSKGRDSADDPSPVHATAPTRTAEGPTGLSPSRLDALRRLAIVKMTEEQRGEYGPVYESCDAAGWLVSVTPAYLIYVAEDSDLPALMKLMHRINPTDGVDLDVHLDIKVVASHFAGPETMEAARLTELVDYGVERFQQYATTPEKARFLSLPSLALLRVTAMALQDVTPQSLFGEISYRSRECDPENIRIDFPAPPGYCRSRFCVQISRFHLGRMMQLVRDLPERGFACFLAGIGTPTTHYQGADRDFTNFLHTFILTVQLIADRKLDEFTFRGFLSFDSQRSDQIARLARNENREFDEKSHYLDRKHMATLGKLLWEFFQLLTSWPFDPTYYRADCDTQKAPEAAVRDTIREAAFEADLRDARRAVERVAGEVWARLAGEAQANLPPLDVSLGDV